MLKYLLPLILISSVCFGGDTINTLEDRFDKKSFNINKVILGTKVRVKDPFYRNCVGYIISKPITHGEDGAKEFPVVNLVCSVKSAKRFTTTTINLNDVEFNSKDLEVIE